MDKLDRTFEDFFTSLGMGVAACTIIVCVGKLLTQHFFYFIILILLATFLVTCLLTYNGKVFLYFGPLLAGPFGHYLSLLVGKILWYLSSVCDNNHDTQENTGNLWHSLTITITLLQLQTANDGNLQQYPIISGNSACSCQKPLTSVGDC